VRQRAAPHLAQQMKESWDIWLKRAGNNIKASKLFKKVITNHYPWSEQYTAKTYTNLIKTYSVFHALDKKTQKNLLSGIYEVVERFGGIEMQYIATLSIAKVKSTL
jgi:hypothetical protein